jgi:hypothetical protein
MRISRGSIDDIVDALVEGVKDTGEFIFAQSQENVARFTDDGTLLHSGYYDRSHPDGFIVGYRAIHAAAVERGHREVVIRNPIPRQVRGYIRGRPGRGNRSVAIQPYTRTYETGAIAHLRYGGRNIGFRVVGTEENPIPAEPPKWYLATAIAEGVRRMPDYLLARLGRIR